MKIRKAEEGDIEWLLVQLKAFSEFQTTKHSLFPEQDWVRREIIVGLIRKHLFLVAESDAGNRVGFVTGLVISHLLNPQLLVCYEVFWWVDTAHRGSKAGFMLLDAFVDWCRANVDWAFFNLQHNTPVSDRALFKRGFYKHESQYLMEF